MTRIYANYDGPNYLVIAKCWYNKNCIRHHFSLPQPLEYYPAHFPAYPALIAAFNRFMPGWRAMLTVTLLGTLGFIVVFYYLLADLGFKQKFWLILVSLFLPARLLVLRSIGAPETLFLASLLFSILMYRRQKYLLSGLSLAFAQATKTPAILLLGAYFLDTIFKDRLNLKAWQKKWPLTLPLFAILVIFLFYRQQTGDFWAYFHSGDNFHLGLLPYHVFAAKNQRWIGTIWLEDIIYIYLLGGLAVTTLWRRYRYDILTTFAAIFYLAILFVNHRDISRYAAPLYPFWIIAFAPLLKSKEFKIIFLLLLPAIFLYAINFIHGNIAPIGDFQPYWAPFR